MKDNKEKFHILLEILIEYSNEDNILTAKDINTYMKIKGYEPIKDNRTINKYIRKLMSLGYDIEIIENNNNYKGYYMASHHLEPYEIKLLSNCIYASKFITRKKSRELVKKLCKLNTIDYKYAIEKNSYIDNRSKTTNEEIFYNTDKIDRAISENKKISFNYCIYNEDKKLVQKLNKDNTIKLYKVNPVWVIYQRDKCYLVAQDPKRNTVLTHYRLDKIKKLDILEEEIDDLGHIKECKNKFNPVEYTKKNFKMYSGKETSRIILEVKRNKISLFIDELGEDVSIKKINDDLCKVEFEANISQGLTSWMLQLGHSAKVIYPDILIENMKNEISKINNLYK